MTLTRRILLLMLLAAPGATGRPAEPVHGITRMEKLAFLLENLLLERRLVKDALFGFEAYDFGPFSSQVYGDLEFLSQQGLVVAPVAPAETDEIVETESAEGAMLEVASIPRDGFAEPVFVLTDKGQALVERKLKPLMSRDPAVRQAYSLARQLKEAFGQKPLNRLVSYVYTKYPDYARNSTIRERVPRWRGPLA